MKWEWNKLLPPPPFSWEEIYPPLIEILREEVYKTGFSNVVLGLSGGIDSSVVLKLAKEAFGKEHVYALLMPSKESSPSSLEDAQEIAEEENISYEIISISPMAEAYIKEKNTPLSKERKGNLYARLRMILLYDYSKEKNALVLGTSNKSEILLGYFTLWGDMAGAIYPLGDLYKTQVRKLGENLHLPSKKKKKPPSADLWPSQTDEEELGISYDLADRILYHWVDLRIRKERIKKRLSLLGEDPSLVDFVLKKVQQTQYKRKLPVIAKLSFVTIRREFRYPRDWGM